MSEMFEFVKIQNMTKAYLMINCEAGSEAQVLDELKTISGIRAAELTLGRHDILALLETSSVDELRDTIIMRIRKIPEILSTTTLMCVDGGR